MPNTEQQDTTVRLPRTLIEQVRSLAQRHERSLSAELRVAIRHYIEQQEASNGKA
jgi:predicted transcriptional regulator